MVLGTGPVQYNATLHIQSRLTKKHYGLKIASQSDCVNQTLFNV